MDKNINTNIEAIVKEVLASISATNGTHAKVPPTQNTAQRVKVADYPLSEKRKDLVRTPTNKSLDDITLKAVLEGNIKAEDLRITPEVLELQAQVAEDAGRKTLAMNFRRAAELTRIPDDRVLQIYNALRPNRSTKQELLDIAAELKDKYQAVITSALVAEAAEVYEARKILR